MLLLSNGLLINEVLRWKAIGAAAWMAVIVLAAGALWSLGLAPTALLSPLRLTAALFSPSSLLASTSLVLALAPAFVAQAGALTAREPAPLHAHRLLQLPGLSALAVWLSKLAARGGSVLGAARLATLYGLHALSAVLCLSLFPAGRGAPLPAASWTLQYGLCLATLFLLHWAYWSQDVLLFPSVQRHRYFRIKQRVSGATAAAAKLAALAYVAAAAAALARAHATGGGLAGAGVPLAPSAAAAALLAGSFCAFCWLMCCAVLQVVFTERLRPDDYSDRDVLAAMAASLAGQKGDLMQGLALHDASLLASDVGKAALRRADIFSDETGDRWTPVAAACIRELDSLCTVVAAAAAQQAPVAPAAGASTATPAPSQNRKWNVLPASMSAKGGLGGSKAQLDALLALRCGYPRAVHAAHALAGFACASLEEDRFGVLQLAQPSLGDVVLCLLGVLGAAQHMMRTTASLASRHVSLGPWQGNGDAAAAAGSAGSPSLDAAALALADVLTVLLYRITATFGEGLAKVLAESKAQPAFGSTADAAALLQQFLKGQA